MDSCTETPFFLVGSERSGSTMLGLMLKQHSQLAWMGQFEYATRYLPAKGWPELTGYYERVEMDRIFQASGSTLQRGLDYPAQMRAFLAQRMARDGKPMVGAAVHKLIHRLPDLWPRARYVYLLRDGRDVARSCIQMGWAGNMWTACDRWLTAEREWRELCRRVPEAQRMEVRYERLVAEPEAVLDEICRFVGVAYEDAMLRYDAGSTYSKPDARYANQWRRKLSAREIRLAELRLADGLSARGYPLSELPPLRLSARDRLTLRMQDKQARVRSRLDRFGWKLLAAEVLSRRLGLKKLHRQVKQKTIDISVTHLK